MKKITIIFLGIVIFLLVLAVSFLMYLYSDAGNARVQAYLEKEIQKQTGLPVVFDRFELGRGHLYFIALLDQGASLGFDGSFDVFSRRVNGRYLLRAANFKYQKYLLRQANVSGNISGTIDDVSLDGKGTLLDGPVSFKLKITNKEPRDIVVQLRKLPADELLALTANPGILKGGLDADILMPSIGEKGSRGDVIIQIKNAHFDPVLVKKLYDYTLPADKTALQGEFRARIDGDKGTFEGKVLSDLVTAEIKNGQMNISEKSIASDFLLDSSELSPLSQNRLKGPLKLSGTIKYDTLGLRVKAKTNSLGGIVDVDYTKTVSARLANVSLSKLLHMFAQPDLAEGTVDGKLVLDSPQAHYGSYILKLSKGVLHGKTINHEYGTSLPPKASMALVSKGKFADGKLSASAKITSNLFTVTASKTLFELKTGKFATNYLLNIPNPLLLAGKNGKGVPVSVSGRIVKNKSLQIKGSTKGLGEKLDFVYTGDRLKIIGKGVRTERLLSCAGQPVALSGAMDIKADFAKLKPLGGTFSISSSALKTDPTEMKKLTGKPIDTAFSIVFGGKAKNGTLYAKGGIKSSIADLSFPKIVYDTQHSSFSTPYSLNIPDLSKVKPVIDADLQGAFVAAGEIKQGTTLTINGTSSSLGGKLTYSYKGDQVDIRSSGAELPRVLHMLKQPEQLLGTADANVRYNTSSRKGTAHLDIKNFQFKPGKLTIAVKMLLQKDLAQVIYDRTVVDAVINGDKISYKISARGRRSDFVIKDGLFDINAKTNKGSFGLRIDNLDVIGTIKGPVKRPKVSVLPGKMLRSKIKKKVVNKVKKEVEKNAGSTVKKIIKKIPLF